MSMLYHFLRCEVRKNSVTDKLETVSPHQGLFDHLKIGQKHPELIASHQGKWPVISLTLKGINGSNVAAIEQGFRNTLGNLYKEHSYLLIWLNKKKNKSAEQAERYFNDVIDNKLKLDSLQQALHLLSQLLYEYHDQKVFVLLDEYDSPLNNTFLEPTLYKEVLVFLRGLLGNCFKDNPYLEKGVMTGILRVAKADLFSGLNNFREYSLLDTRYAEHFGFTDGEVSALFDHPLVRELISAHAPDPEAIKAWYNGYTIGGITIYNPWSIMSCISERGRLAPYWVATGSDTLLRDLLKDNDMLIQQLEELLSEERLEVVISPHINMLDMAPCVKFWSLMLAAGYATLAGEIPTAPSLKLSCEIRIPNTEVRAVHEDLIIGWFTHKIGVAHYSELIRSLFYGEIEAFSKELNRYLEEATSLRNIGPYRAEQFYNGFMVGLLIIMRKEFAIASEIESGKGYADTLMIPRHKKAPGAVILEYKVARSKEELESKAEEALRQIDEKAYIARVKPYEHVGQIVKVGIAFCGKEALITREVTKLN